MALNQSYPVSTTVHEIGLGEKAMAIHNRILDLQQRLGEIGDSIYGATPQAINPDKAAVGKPLSLQFTMEAIINELAICEERVDRIARGL